MIGWIGSIFLALGVVATGYRRRWGFLIGAWGESLWVWKAYATDQFDLLVICVLFVILYLNNWRLWK
jgi:hypothetical protein